LEPLRHPAFRYLAAGRLVVMLGNSIAPIALAFAVLDLTGSAADLGLVVGARSLMNVAFILFGGVVADRVPRNVVLLASCCLAALSQGAVAALVLTGSATIPLLVGLAAVNGVVSAFAFPAAAALIAQTVPEHLLMQANAVNRLGTSGAMILGASLGGVLVASFGSGWGLAVDAATFAVAGFLYGLVRVTDHRVERGATSGVLRDLRTGWTEFASRTWVWVVVLGFCFINMAFVAGLSVLGPVVADGTIGRRLWGVVLATETVGMVVGALIALRVKARRLLLVGVVCCFGDLLLVLALGVAPHIAVLLPAAFLAGVALEQFGIAWEVSIQEHIPADRLARVYSYDALGSFLAIPIGQIAAGPVAEIVGFDWALVGCATVIALSTVGMLASRDVRTLEHLPARAAVPAPRPASTDQAQAAPSVP
jgi:MFS family permease